MASMLPADYEGTDLEERQVMARWGGQVVLVPWSTAGRRAG
jgi:hypothetical protein